MKTKELKEKSLKELEKILGDYRETLRKLRFDLASGKVKNVRKIREIKKDVARILTVINNKDNKNKEVKNQK